MREIVDRDHVVLRKKAAEVPLDEIQSPKIQKIVADMKESLESQDDGVAIAAPQIGESLRIFVVSGRAISMIKDIEERSADIVFINPKIVKLSKETELLEEGCLSVRYLYGKVKRSTRATVEAYDESGTKFKMGGAGLLAQIFQHETDHLDGVLFTDKATDVKDMPPSDSESSDPEHNE